MVGPSWLQIARKSLRFRRRTGDPFFVCFLLMGHRPGSDPGEASLKLQRANAGRGFDSSPGPC